MELSTLIGKQILSPNGEILGYVKNAYLTQGNKKLSSLECIDGEEDEFFLSARSVLSVGDAVIASRARLAAPTGTPCPIGTAAYSHMGERLGAVGDLLLGDAAPVYVLIKDGVRTSYAAECVSCGETVIVYPDAATKRSATRSKAKSAGKKKERPTAIEKPEVQEPPQMPAPQTEPPQPTEQTEPEYRCNLLGRTVKKSLYDCFGFPIVVAGEKITPAVLSAARRNNLLLQLTVNTLTNIY